MWTFPILFDCDPSFAALPSGGSILLAPLGFGTVLSHCRERLAAISGAPPVIVRIDADVDEAYADAIKAICPDVESIETLESFRERLHSYQSSDCLLFAHPNCLLLDAMDPALARLNERTDPRTVKHLIAFGRDDEGPKEFVETDASGRVRSIRRYYDSVTWPISQGVAASIVPVAGLRLAHELPITDLPSLRRKLATEGFPSEDVLLEQGAVNLCLERELLANNQAIARRLARGFARGQASSLPKGEGVRVHASARIFGPVILQDHVEIGEGVTLIGPAVIGRQTRVEAGATIVQSVVGSNQVVRAGTTVRHRVLLAQTTSDAVATEPPTDPRGIAEIAAGEPNWHTNVHDPLTVTPGSRRYARVKRAIDIAVAAVALTLLAPLWLAIAIAVKLDSKGSIHFGHVREGLGGRPFRCWKFRTMISGADQIQRKLAKMNKVDGPQFKVDKDPRRTRVGKWLAAANLDEIPQLWNVLLGEMSLVGPRPSPFRENQLCVPWRDARLSVRPGVTGLWQICRHDRHLSDFHQWIYYDLIYVRHSSFWVDLKIAALTPISMTRGGGSIPLHWLVPAQDSDAGLEMLLEEST